MMVEARAKNVVCQSIEWSEFQPSELLPTTHQTFSLGSAQQMKKNAKQKSLQPFRAIAFDFRLLNNKIIKY